MKYRIFSEDFVYVALNVKGYGTDLLKFPSDVFSKFPKNSVTGMVEIEEVKKVCSKIWVDKCGIISYDEALKNSEVIISSMITEVYDEIIYKYSEFIRMTENIRYCENIKELVSIIGKENSQKIDEVIKQFDGNSNYQNLVNLFKLYIFF